MGIEGGKASSLEKTKRQGRRPHLLGEWMSSYLTNAPPGLWQAGLWGRQHSCGFFGFFVFYSAFCALPAWSVFCVG